MQIHVYKPIDGKHTVLVIPAPTAHLAPVLFEGRDLGNVLEKVGETVEELGRKAKGETVS